MDFVTKLQEMAEELGWGKLVVIALTAWVGSAFLKAILGLFAPLAKLTLAIAGVIVANPIVAAIVAIAAAALLIYGYWEDIAAFFETLWAEVKAVIDVDAWAETLKQFSLLDVVKGWFSGVTGWLGKKWAEVKALIDVDAWAETLKQFSLLDAVKEWFSGVTDWLGKKWAEITSYLPDWLKEELGLKISAPVSSFADGPGQGAPRGIVGPEEPSLTAAPASETARLRTARADLAALADVAASARRRSTVDFRGMPRGTRTENARG